MKVALGFHTEKLHEDKVWRRIHKIARLMARHEIKATFFIYPFRSQVADVDIVDKVRALKDLEHEIGQHTHFYSGIRIDKYNKVNDFGEQNTRSCLLRDFEALRKIGISPQGFSAGAWVMNSFILDNLIELGFSYDCSARYSKLTMINNNDYHLWLKEPQLYMSSKGRLVCLPTTCSIGEWFKWGRKVAIDKIISYQLVYLHDYDLISVRHYLMLLFFLLIKKNEFININLLTEQVKKGVRQ